MKPYARLALLIWVPFLSIFAFAAPPVVAAVGDSYPHIAFHLFSPAMLSLAWLHARRLRRTASTRAVRVLLGTLLVTVPVAVVGNVLELVAALVRLAEDGWVSRATPELFASEGGLHALASQLTIPAHLLSLVVVVLALIVGTRASRRVPAGTR